MLFFLLICNLRNILLLKITYANSQMMPQLVALFTLNIRSSPTFERRMAHSTTVLARRKSFAVSIIVACVSCCFLGVEIILLVFLPLVFLCSWKSNSVFGYLYSVTITCGMSNSFQAWECDGQVWQMSFKEYDPWFKVLCIEQWMDFSNFQCWMNWYK